MIFESVPSLRTYLSIRGTNFLLSSTTLNSDIHSANIRICPPAVLPGLCSLVPLLRYCEMLAAWRCLSYPCDHHPLLCFTICYLGQHGLPYSLATTINPHFARQECLRTQAFTKKLVRSQTFVRQLFDRICKQPFHLRGLLPPDAISFNKYWKIRIVLLFILVQDNLSR